MSLFIPQTARHLTEFFNDIVKKWEQLTPEEKESVDWINPDEPIVLSVPNPEFDGKQNEDEDDYGNSRKILLAADQEVGWKVNDCAKRAYAQADAMLKERERGE